jgi:hypothetical protein
LLLGGLFEGRTFNVLIACPARNVQALFWHAEVPSMEAPQRRPVAKGQNRAYTGLFTLFDLTVFDVSGELKANVFLPQSLVALE